MRPTRPIAPGLAPVLAPGLAPVLAPAHAPVLAPGLAPVLAPALASVLARGLAAVLARGHALVLAAALALGSCRLPPFSPPGAPSNVVVAGGLAYASLAEDGIGVYRAGDGVLVRRIAPAPGSESVDDLALADGLLFALDAKSPGHLSVYSLERIEEPRLASPPVLVPVGPFSGVSAAAGRAIVSGGTSDLTVLRYAPSGAIASERTTLDLGRGQPDVLLAPGGGHAFVSTHFSLIGDTFGLTTMEVAEPPRSSRALATLEIEGAGFTPGGRRPANFPIEMALAGETLLVACGPRLALVDVRDPAAPRLERVVPLGLDAVSVDAAGAKAVVVGSSPRPELVLLDLAAEGGPRIVSRAALPEGSLPTGVALGDGFAVVAGQEGGLASVRLP